MVLAMNDIDIDIDNYYVPEFWKRMSPHMRVAFVSFIFGAIITLIAWVITGLTSGFPSLNTHLAFNMFFSTLVSAAVPALALLYIVHESINPRHWLDCNKAHKIEYANSGFFREMYPAWDNRKSSSDVVAWCMVNCRGRWRFAYGKAYFSHMQDATLFKMFWGSNDGE